MKIGPAAALTATVVVLIAGAGYLVSLHGCPGDVPQIIGTVDTLPDKQLTQERPKPPASLGQKITRHTVPANIGVSQGTPDTVRSSWYADAAHEADSLRHLVDSLKRGDSTDQARAERVAKPRPLLPPVAGVYTGKYLKLYLTRADGSLLRATARLHPHFRFYSGQNKLTDTFPAFDEDRWFLRVARQMVRCAIPTAVMGIAGAAAAPLNEKRERKRLTFAAVAGGIALLGCLAG